MALSACGGGSEEGGAGNPPPPGPVNPGPPTPALQAHLSACPTGIVLNENVPCMVGLYEGQTVNGGAYCAFNVASDGVVSYVTGTQAVRVDRRQAFSVTVFEKRALGNATDFSVGWSIGIGSGNGLEASYRVSDAPASANGLLIRPERTALAACLVSSGPTAAATASDTTANLLGRTWQRPQVVNGSEGAVSDLPDQSGFDAGLADDGRAFIAFRQPDANGRLAVHVVEGRPGAAGQNPSWTAPQILDADAPFLTTGQFRPRIAVSANGHAVVMWATQRACESDGYYGVNAGQTCRYVYASRRLATESAWEPAQRVSAAALLSPEYEARINANGDLVLVFHGTKVPTPGSTFFDPALDSRVMIARRRAADTGYRIDRSEWMRSSSELRRFNEWVHVHLDDASNVVIAAETNSIFGAVLRTRLDMTQPLTENAELTHDGFGVYESAVSGGGFAAYTWKSATGPYNIRQPLQMMIYSPLTEQWTTTDLTAYMLWGDVRMVGTDSADGEFLIYAGCRLTAWRAGRWGATRNLPAYCGLDRPGGVYAFNRRGDYLGIQWAGQPGQWGYYSHAEGRLLKGAPGSGPAVSGDYVLGTPSALFGAAPTQLRLARNGLALAVTSNTYTTLPSATDATGVQGTTRKLWATYLK